MNINSLINMIARTVIRGGVYRAMGKTKGAVILVPIIVAVVFLLATGSSHGHR